jgi:hypothetical protein
VEPIRRSPSCSRNASLSRARRRKPRFERCAKSTQPESSLLSRVGAGALRSRAGGGEGRPASPFVGLGRSDRSLKDAEVTQRPPEKHEEEDRRQASAPQFFGAPTCRQPTQEFAHIVVLSAAVLNRLPKQLGRVRQRDDRPGQNVHEHRRVQQMCPLCVRSRRRSHASARVGQPVRVVPTEGPTRGAHACGIALSMRAAFWALVRMADRFLPIGEGSAC